MSSTELLLTQTSLHVDDIVCVSSGDVLLSINAVDLTQLTYSEAVSVLKAQTAQSQVVLCVIQTLSDDTDEESEAANKDELDPVDDLRDDTLNWTPLWTRWLGLPRWRLRQYIILFLHFKCTSFLYDSAPVVSVTCTGAGTLSCRRPTTRAGASVSWGATKRATASSLSSSKPLCRVRLLTLTDASSKLGAIWLLYPVITRTHETLH